MLLHQSSAEDHLLKQVRKRLPMLQKNLGSLIQKEKKLREMMKIFPKKAPLELNYKNKSHNNFLLALFPLK